MIYKKKMRLKKLKNQCIANLFRIFKTLKKENHQMKIKLLIIYKKNQMIKN